MSRKVGKTKLNEHRRAVLAFQNRREDKLRRVRERQSLDERRRVNVRQALERTNDLIKQIEQILVAARGNPHVEQIVSELGAVEPRLQLARRRYNDDYDSSLFASKQMHLELSSWEKHHAEAKAEIDRVLSRQLNLSQYSELWQFEEAAREFERLVASYGDDIPDERYTGGSFDSIDQLEAHRQLEDLEAESQRLLRLATTRATAAGGVIEPNTLTRLLSTGAALRLELAALPATLLNTDDVVQLNQALDEAERLQLDDPQVAADQLRRAIEQAEVVLGDARAGFAERQAARDPALVELTRALDDIVALDQAFLSTWAPSQFAALEQLVTLSRTASMSFDSSAETLKAHLQELQTQLTATNAAAQQAHLLERERETIVGTYIETFRKLGFQVRSARRANPADPQSEVVLDVVRGGQVTTATFLPNDDDMGVEVRLNMTDGLSGTDCVKDVSDLAVALAKYGAIQEIVDWGDVSPERRSTAAGVAIQEQAGSEHAANQ